MRKENLKGVAEVSSGYPFKVGVYPKLWLRNCMDVTTHLHCH